MTGESQDWFFRCLAHGAAIGILATDRQCVVRFCNEAAVTLLGRPAAELIGQPVNHIVPPDRTDLVQRLLECLLETGKPSEFEFRHPLLDGRRIHIAATFSPVRDEDEVVGVSVFLRDISRQFSLLMDMAQTQKMAALESMAGAIAHHFNNILGGAVTTADFALASDDPDLHKRTLGITVAALSRANELTHGLMAFAEGEHATTGHIDLRQGIEVYVAGIEPALHARNIRLELDLQPVSVALPPKTVTLLLDRLVTNAMEAMPNGGTLTIHLQQVGDNQAVLRISDTGQGISEHDLPRVFEPFFTTKQPDRSRNTNHPGLGLAVVHGIAKDLGGTLTVTSEPGAGTTLTLRLPSTAIPSARPA